MNSLYEDSLACICKLMDNTDIPVIGLSGSPFSKGLGKYYNNLRKLRDYTESLGKMFMLILPLYPSKSREKYKNYLMNEGFIVYPSVRRAAKSFLALYEYGRKIKALKNQ